MDFNFNFTTVEAPVKKQEAPCNCSRIPDRHKVNPSTSPIIWVLGGAGSEKRKLSLMIANAYGYQFICISDLIKSSGSLEIPGTSQFKTVDTVIQRDGIVPADFVVDLVEEIMVERAETAKGYVLNGFPKTKEQAKIFQRRFTVPRVILYFEVSRTQMISTLMPEKKNIIYCQHPSIDYIIDKIKKFIDETEQLLELYPTKVRRIDAMRPIREIFTDVRMILDPFEDLAAMFRIEDEYARKVK